MARFAHLSPGDIFVSVTLTAALIVAVIEAARDARRRVRKIRREWLRDQWLSDVPTAAGHHTPLSSSAKKDI